MFTGRQQIVIRGGTFIHVSTSEGLKILHEKIATDAFHDSGERFDPPKCHPNTRVAVLEEIMQWIQVTESSELVLWLYGSAGAGKSAIAQTIAEISLQTQVEWLLIRPLENACADVDPTDAKQWPKVIVVDGLDECHGPSIQCSIIRVLSAALRRVPVPLILLITSRPEPHIRNTFNLLIKSHSHASRHIFLDDSYESDADIRKFVVSRFKEIKENHPLATYIPESWPSEEIVDRLVRKSSGQFIYASTVMKYLDSPKHRPMKRLDVIIGLRPAVGDMPYIELDALYSHIFSCVEDSATTLKILGILFFGYFSQKTHSPFSRTPEDLARLLRLDEEDVYLHLSELHSILYIPPPPDASELEIRPMHASLQDFLVDKLRSGKYYLDEEAFHTDLARQCVHHLSAWSMNPALKGVYPSVERYLAHSFIHHCTHASTDSADLKHDLMQLCDLRPWFEDVVQVTPHMHLSPLFEWLYKAETAAKELSSHILSLWDRYLLTMLSEHTFNGSNVDIAGLLFLPPSWNLHWFSLISGNSQVPDVFQSYHIESYQSFLRDFFEDKARSGKYHVDGVAYAHAALECLRNIINPHDIALFNPFLFLSGIKRPDPKLFMYITESMIPGSAWGCHGVTQLLSKAAPLTDLYFYLQDHPLQNPAKTQVHREYGLAALRLAVKVYLEKCKHIYTRSASCLLYPPYMDVELEMEKRSKTFNERWLLRGNRLSYERPPYAVKDTRVLPEMKALRSGEVKRKRDSI